jgi:hypothetical protein
LVASITICLFQLRPCTASPTRSYGTAMPAEAASSTVPAETLSPKGRDHWRRRLRAAAVSDHDGASGARRNSRYRLPEPAGADDSDASHCVFSNSEANR